ncbi:MAG TPA: hypothetical protein GX717_07385 [Clostridiaceae bacterium]|nr:hypothetical protein [Clostridiaceae bacterium]
MKEQIRFYVDGLFAEIPPSAESEAMKFELLDSLVNKYDDYINMGISEQVAYSKVVNSVGDFSEISRELQRNISVVDPLASPDAFYARQERRHKRHAILLSVGIGLYVISLAAVIAIPSELGVVMMFVIAAIATVMVILANTLYGKKNSIKQGEQFVEDFQTWRQENDEKVKTRKLFESAFWIIITVIYLIVSFLTGAWHITWIIFLLGASLSELIKGILLLNNPKKSDS